jgi:hypothetical protein
MSSFRPIIELWGRRSNLAEDLKIPRITVQQWWLRDSIPAEYFGDVVAAAQKRGIRSVTERALLDLLYARRHVPATEDTLAPRDGSEVGAP